MQPYVPLQQVRTWRWAALCGGAGVVVCWYLYQPRVRQRLWTSWGRLGSQLSVEQNGSGKDFLLFRLRKSAVQFLGEVMFWIRYNLPLQHFTRGTRRLMPRVYRAQQLCTTKRDSMGVVIKHKNREQFREQTGNIGKSTFSVSISCRFCLSG